MEVQFSAEQDAQLSRLASHEGKNPEQFAKDVILRTLEDNERFLATVRVGVDQADRAEFVSHEEVKGRIDRLLQQ